MLEDEIRTKGFVRKFFGGDRATKLEAKVRGLVEQSRHFGELVRDVCDIKGDILLTEGLEGEEFKQNLETIFNLLSDDKVSSVGIYGMGGVGKTTLAKHVNNQLQQETQKRVAWITVSQEFTIPRLQDEIAKFVHLDDFWKEPNEDKRASRLNEVLSEIKNLVFILDDVWKDLDLKKLGDPLSLDGCKLLITTRSEKVCHQMGCERFIKVKTLKENEAWNLFKESHGQVMNLSIEVQDIAKSLVDVCDGLPLGIITIAGSMKGETDYHAWSDALAEFKESIMGQEDMEEKVFKVLKHSFDRLDQQKAKKHGYSRLQQCFLYCSLYPEDYKIGQEELIRKFILEEFLDKRDSRKALISQGHAVLNKLVNACLLERIGDKVKMHDLVRAMALKINEGKTKSIVGHPSLKEISVGEEWTKDIEKISLMTNGMERIEDKVSPNCPKLSTLLLFGDISLRFIPNSFFLQMPNLFILDLSKTWIKKLPDSLSNLVSLKALLLKDSFQLEYVPYLGNMKELRELDLSQTKITEIPQGMEKLSNLKFLSLFGTRLKMLPECVLMKFLYLQCLHLPCHIQPQIEEIQELKHMEEFSGGVQGACDFNRLMKIWPSVQYNITMGDSQSNFNCLMEIWPNPADNITMIDSQEYFYLLMKIWPRLAYNLTMRSIVEEIEFEYRGYSANTITIHPYQLEFSDYDFGSRKDKDVMILAQGIQNLALQTCKGLSNCLLEDLQRLNNPTSIRMLTLWDCKEIECLSRIEQSPNKDTMASTSISISSPPPHAFFSFLRKLDIFSCNQMKRLGLPTSQIQNLEFLIIRSCDMIEEIVDVSEDIEGRESGEASSVISLPKLAVLYLEKLPKLKSICSTTMICTSLAAITLFECQGLEELPILFGEPNYDSPPECYIRIELKNEERKWCEKLKFVVTSHHSIRQPFIRWK